MKNARIKKIIIVVVVVVLVVILIVIIGLIVKKNSEILKEKYTGTITCSKEIQIDNEYYKIYEIQEIQVNEGITKEKNSLFKIVYKNEDDYKGFKENENDLQNPKFDDANLTIIYDHDGKIDLSKDPEGESVDIPYTNTIDELESEGYSCSLDKLKLMNKKFINFFTIIRKYMLKYKVANVYKRGACND